MNTDWTRACAVTLDYEGGNDDDPRDPGGRTSRGITQREWDRYCLRKGLHGSDVFKAPQLAIVDIYRTSYWDAVAGDDWPVGTDLCVYDAAVNSGVGKAATWAHAALGQANGTFGTLAATASALADQIPVIRRYQAKRLSFLHALRTWAYFGRGWGSRVAGIEAIAIRWAAASRGSPVAPVLIAHAQAAARKGRAAGGAAAGTAAPTAAHVATTQPTGWLDWAATGLTVAIALLVVCYLLHHYRVNAVRATALAKEAAK